MMTLLESYVRRGRRVMKKLWQKPVVRRPLQWCIWFLAGLCLTAASLGNAMQPVALAFLCAGISGWMGLPFALGGSVGYWLFWGVSGSQGVAWMAAGIPVCALLYPGKYARNMPLLQPALAGLIVAVWGVIFQVWQDDTTSILLYILRLVLAFGGTWLFMQARSRRDPAAEWGASALWVLALAQIAPLRFLGLGFVAAAAMVAVLPFPAVALAGLALDLAQVTPVPMTAVLCLSYMLRLLPGARKGVIALAPAFLYGVVMGLCGQVDLMPVPALLVGGACGALWPRQNRQIRHHRGETGFAQVRLELAAEVMGQSERLLLEVGENPIDTQTLIQKAVERACGGCPCRKQCKERDHAQALPVQLLSKPLASVDELPIPCKKRTRLLAELRRSQERYRTMKADRERQTEYRGAVIQQYRFLAEYLQDLADRLPQRGNNQQVRYQPEVAVCASGKEKSNGDRCLWFAGTECRYYLLLCDGMGTGEEAAREARVHADILRKLLMAGYPAPYALRSLNSLCTLRDNGAAVTVDLAEFCLDNGKVTLYKWGAAPSWLLLPTGVERIGAATVPPGFSVTQGRETVERITMRRGETLVLTSDGVDGHAAIRGVPLHYMEPCGALAGKILEAASSEDDATVAVIRLVQA